jgi:hypothetical protein
MGVDRMMGMEYAQLLLLFMIFWKLDKVQYRQWKLLGDEEE